MLPLLLLSLVSGADLVAHTELDGLDVLVVPLPGAPCSVRLTVQAGAGEDPPGMGGLAHVVEHLTFGGTRGRTVMLSNHANINAMTTMGGTVFTLETTAAYCEAELTSLLSMVTDGKLRRSWFGPEMEVIHREALYRTNTRAILDTALFGHTAASVIGSAATRETIKHIDVVRFFQNHYEPQNMALIAVGGIEPEAVQRALTTSFSARG
jgi:zinc protease